MKTGHISEAFRMERISKGMPVTWNTLEKVVKKTASGREKVDYERRRTRVYMWTLEPLWLCRAWTSVQDLDGNLKR